MNRSNLLSFVSYFVTDCGNAGPCSEGEVPDHARLVAFQCGFEPLVVAVWSYLPECRLDDGDAEELAIDYLQEIDWISDASADVSADFIL